MQQYPQLPERVASVTLGIMEAQLSALVCYAFLKTILLRGLKGPLNTMLLRGFKGPLNWFSIMPRNASLPDSRCELCSRAEKDKIPKPDGVELLRVGGGLICNVLIT